MLKQYWEYSPKKLRFYARLLFVLACVLALLDLLLYIVSVPLGAIFSFVVIYLILVSKKYKKVAMQKEEGIFTPPATVQPTNSKSHSVFVFPETDGHGHSALNVYNMNIVGVMHEKDGINPQDIIPQMFVGDQVFLEADPSNTYDSCAVKVKTVDGAQIGWLPKGENLQIDISKRLQKGQTVLARVKEKYELPSYPGCIGLCIEVARFSTR